MTIKEFFLLHPEISGWSFTEQIKFFAWHLHAHRSRSHFTTSDITACFEEVGLNGPSNCARMIQALGEKKPKQVLRGPNGYQLEVRVKAAFDEKYGLRDHTIKIHQLLTDLVPRMPNDRSREYLQEALTCLRHKAYRAATVMAWNVTFDHLCNWILNNAGRTSAFNQQLLSQFQKKSPRAVTQRSDFSELQESDVITVCRIAGLLDKNVVKILNEKLDKRNQAAHPSGVVVDQLTAESSISDLMNNVVLVLV